MEQGQTEDLILCITDMYWKAMDCSDIGLLTFIKPL